MAKLLVNGYHKCYKNSLAMVSRYRIWNLFGLTEGIRSIHLIAGEILKDPVLNLKNKTPFVFPNSTILSTLAGNTDIGQNKQMNLTKIINSAMGDNNFASHKRDFCNNTSNDKKKRCSKAIPCKKRRRRAKKSDSCKRDPNDVCARRAAFKCFDKCEPKPIKKKKQSLRTKKVTCSAICVSAAEAKKSGRCNKSIPCKDKEELDKIRSMKAEGDGCKKDSRCPTERDDPCKPKEGCKEPCTEKVVEPCKVVRGDPCKKKDEPKCK